MHHHFGFWEKAKRLLIPCLIILCLDLPGLFEKFEINLDLLLAFQKPLEMLTMVKEIEKNTGFDRGKGIKSQSIIEAVVSSFK